MTTDRIIENLLSEIDDAINNFNDAIPEIQKEIFKRVQVLLKDLSLSGDQLNSSVSNIKSIARLKSSIEDAILNPSYLQQVADFTDAFSVISELQDQYFSSLVDDYGASKLTEALKTQAIDETVTSLTESGISVNVTEGIQQILKSNIIGGAGYSDLVEQMRSFILSDENGLGALERYTKQITTDALNQYSAQYNQIISADLNLKWHQYVGSLLKTSRQFCIKLVDKRYIHESELEEILQGHIDGSKIPMNPKTGVWYGGIEGTTIENFATNRGGYGCGHQYLGCDDSQVPEEIRRKLYEKIGDQAALDAIG